MNSLLLAVKANDVGEVQRLLTFSPICRKLVNYQAPQNHETPLFVASVRGYTGVVRWLLNRGARVDVTTSWGATALHAAAERGHDSIIKLLLEQKAPLHIQTQYGDTALHLAAFRGHHRVILLLLAAGIDTTITNSKGRTAVDEAEIAGHHIISKRLRLSRSSEDPNIEEKMPAAFGPMKTQLLKSAPQHSTATAWVGSNTSAHVPCNPPHDVGFDVDKHIVQTAIPGQLDTQARVKDWVMNSAAAPMKMSPNPLGSPTKVRFRDDDRVDDTEVVFAHPAPQTPSHAGSKAKPMKFPRRKAAMLKDVGKSHSCEGVGETKLPGETMLPDFDDGVTVTPHARCRRVNSLERSVEELQNELRETREEMERAKADIMDIQDMMRLCWARGGGAVITDRVAASEAPMIGQRYIISPMSSDVINPFESRRHSNPQFQMERRKEAPQCDGECMSE